MEKLQEMLNEAYNRGCRDEYARAYNDRREKSFVDINGSKPLTIEGSFTVVNDIIEKHKKNERYFLIRQVGCGAGSNSDIVGITTDEEVAKEYQDVFNGYEEVKLLDNIKETNENA